MSSSSLAPVPYPVHWEADVVLADGGTAHVRPIGPQDADALQAFHAGQSERSTYFRFFTPMERLGRRDLERFTTVDHVDRVALVAVVHAEVEQIIAVARYDRIDAAQAEVAFNVSDAHHGRGIGSVLLEHLVAAARERGVRRFVAQVLPGNAQMLAVFAEAGFDVTQESDDGVVVVTFDIDPTDRSLEVMADREHRAEARSMQAFFRARSVVVVGPGAAGRGRVEEALAETALRNLLRSGFDGSLHAVGLAYHPGDRVNHWSTLADVPGRVDLALVALPAVQVAGAVRRLGSLGARGLVLLSEGFAETGAAGLARQREVLRLAHAAGMRVIGPGSFGFFLTDPDAPLNASLWPRLPWPGGLGLFCQSAAMAGGLLTAAEGRGLGVSSFLSSGNRADVSGNDAMQFWEDHGATEVVGLYLETIGNPRKFTRVARRLSGRIPVIVATAGQAAHVVPAGHAVRATRAPHRAVEEMLRQSGVIRAEGAHQLLDIAQLLLHQPLPTGPRVAVVASSPAVSAVVSEAASAAGLEVIAHSARLDAGADPAELRATLEAVYSGGVDVVVAVHLPVLGGADPDVVRVLAEVAAAGTHATVACVLGMRGITDALTAAGADGRPRTVPAYSTPQDAVLALATVVDYARRRQSSRGRRVHPAGIDAERARALVAAHLAGAGHVGPAGPAGQAGPVGAVGQGVRDDTPAVVLDSRQTAELLACYGIEVWPTLAVHHGDDAVRAAEALGWPVALKSTDPRLRHRADLGGVRLDITSPEHLRENVEQMRRHLEVHGWAQPSGSADDGGPAEPGQTPAPFEVQRMAEAGVACVVRTAEDPLFGPMVAFGLAGDATDLLGDVAYAIPPLTDVDVEELVRTPRAAPRLSGYRGMPAMDVAALRDVVARVSVLADDLPEVRSLELHPVVVSQQGTAVLRAHVELAPAGRADAPRRALPE